MSFRNEVGQQGQPAKYGQQRLPPQALGQRNKKDIRSTDRLKVSPSPIKTTDSSQKQQQRKVEVSQVPESLKDSVENTGNNKILIRQFELVEFTKKFAIQKADYEDRIEALLNERDSLNQALSRLEGDLRQASQLLSNRDSLQAQETCRNNKLIHDLQAGKARTEGELSAVRSQNNRLRSELELLEREAADLMKALTAEKSKSSDLDRIKMSMIDSNNKLSDENQQLVLATKRMEGCLNESRVEVKNLMRSNQQLSNSLASKDSEIRRLGDAAATIEQQLRSKTLQFEIACMRVIMLGAALEGRIQSKRKGAESSPAEASNRSLSMRSTEEQLKMNINILQIQSDHARQQYLLEKEKMHVTQQHLMDENAKLSEQLRDKNKRIFELTIQSRPDMGASTMRTSMDAKDSQRVQTSGRMSTSYQLRHGDVPLQKSRADGMQERQSPCGKCRNLEREVQTLQTKCQYLQKDLSEAQSYIQEQENCRDQLAEQYEYLKTQLTEHLAVKCENKRLSARMRMMEQVLTTLRSQNQQLKQLTITPQQPPIFSKQLRQLVFCYERQRMSASQDMDRLQQQLTSLKSQLNTSTSEHDY